MLISAIAATSAMAAPAWPKKMKMTGPDGQPVEVFLRGDEFYHYYESAADGTVMLREADGKLRYAALDNSGRVVAATAKANDTQALKRAMAQTYTERKAAAMAKRLAPTTPGTIHKDFPTVGTVRGLVILAQFQDVKFSQKATNKAFEEVFNSENYSGELASGSVREYFTKQSSGLFTPEFDVVGPITLPKDMAHYGVSENMADLFKHAADEADKAGVDFTKYDADADGTVDFVFIVYAGYGQAQGGAAETVWPQQVDLTYQIFNEYDGMYLGKGACSCELHGYEGEQIDGIGTFCHEFSHILGLPDVYDTMYTGSFGLAHWDVMDIGSYNDDSRTPACYTAMDRYTVGWMEPKVLTGAEGVASLTSLEENNDALFILADDDANEYYTLENRQPNKWDKALPAHGMLISHIKYDRTLWQTNMVNTARAGYEHIQLVAADNKYSESDEDGDLFPGKHNVTEFSGKTTPAMTWRGNNATEWTLSNIAEAEDGTISFSFKSAGTTAIGSTTGTAGAKVKTARGLISIANPGAERIEVVAADGKTISHSTAKQLDLNVKSGLYIIKVGGKLLKTVVD